jgi:hypothetical protein
LAAAQHKQAGTQIVSQTNTRAYILLVHHLNDNQQQRRVENNNQKKRKLYILSRQLSFEAHAESKIKTIERKTIMKYP